jgi:hypothetical protein
LENDNNRLLNPPYNNLIEIEKLKQAGVHDENALDFFYENESEIYSDGDDDDDLDYQHENDFWSSVKR